MTAATPIKTSLCATLVVLCSAGAALAYGNCGARDIVTQTLSQEFGESPLGAGLEGDTALYEVWQSEDGESWTILRTRADGVTCVLATGTDWRPALPRPPGIEG